MVNELNVWPGPFKNSLRKGSFGGRLSIKFTIGSTPPEIRLVPQASFLTAQLVKENEDAG